MARRPQKSHIAVLLSGLVVGSAGMVTVLESWGKVGTMLHLKKDDASVLAEKTAEGEFLRQLTVMITQRLFWAERYSGGVADGFPKDEIEESWKQYNKSVIAWNEKYILNFRLAELYFGDKGAGCIKDLHWLLRRSNTCLNKVHYSSLYEKNPGCFSPGEKGNGATTDNLRILDHILGDIGKGVIEFTQLVSIKDQKEGNYKCTSINKNLLDNIFSIGRQFITRVVQ